MCAPTSGTKAFQRGLLTLRFVNIEPERFPSTRMSSDTTAAIFAVDNDIYFKELTMADAIQPKMVTGLFKDRDSAERAYQSVSSRGYDTSDINLAMSEDTRKKHFTGTGATTTELGNKAAEGAGVGGAIGGTIGAIAAAVAAVGTSLVIPGLGLVIAGPAVAALAGAGAGGVAGGLIGALVGWGIPEERVKHYEQGIKEGGIVMGVKPRSDEDAKYFSQEWKNNKGEHIYP